MTTTSPTHAGCMYIITGVGLDVAVSLPTHIHLVALHSHNATTIQIALFTTLVVQLNTTKQTTPTNKKPLSSMPPSATLVIHNLMRPSAQN